ncbi:MAG: FAD-binding oxidoreductase [Ferrimicrobium sp.]
MSISQHRRPTTESLLGLERALRQSGIATDASLASRRRASRDFSWLSPVLAKALPRGVADLVVRPLNRRQLTTCIEVAIGHHTPVTLRGRGTGNYAQSVPLEGGMVIDTTGVRQVLAIETGWITAEAGASMRLLERTARKSGQELTITPTTFESTLGGFLAGGSGGLGSLEHGLTTDGFVGDLEVLAADQWLTNTRLHSQYDSSAANPWLGSCGTIGIITSARVRLTRAQQWVGVTATTKRLEDAIALGQLLLKLDIPMRLLSVTDSALASLLGQDLTPGASLRALVSAPVLGHVIDLIRDHGATPGPNGVTVANTVVRLSFNHVTLHANSRHPSLIHLQLSGPELTTKLAAIKRAVPGALLHLDAITAAGVRDFIGLMLIEFRGLDRLQGVVDTLENIGIVVQNPHSWRVEDIDGLRARHATAFDPYGILNPGKLQRPTSPGSHPSDPRRALRISPQETRHQLSSSNRMDATAKAALLPTWAMSGGRV